MDRQGRYEFFAQQYETYLARVLNYVRLRVGDEALAQDLTAETFERALAHIGTLRDTGAFGGWLFRIARNVIAAHYRSRRGEVSLEWVEGYAAQDPTEAGPETAESAVLHAEALAAMRRTLRTLPEREQEIVRLRFVAGLSHRAIGKAMGLRAGNVAVILYRALRKLRAQLEREDL